MPFKPGVIPNMGDVSQATRVQLSGLGRGRRSNGGGRRRRRTSKAARRTRTSRGSKRVGRPARLQKGSAAAKRYMASIRPKRGKRRRRR